MPHETKNPRNIICNNYRLVKFGPQSPIVAGCIVAPVYILAQLSLWSSVQGFLVIANFVFHGNLHPLCTRAPEEDMSRPWFGPTTSCTAGEHSSKELLQQLMPLLFGTFIWLPQCMAFIHSARSKSSNVGLPTMQLLLPE
jgi:hypothetical protein